MLRSVLTAVAAAAFAATAWLPATAADLYEPPIVEAPPPAVEIAPVSTSGWYIRGDIDYSWLKFKGATYTVVSPNYDCCGNLVGARMVDGNVLNGTLRSSFSAGAGVGYKINSVLRTDLTFDYQFRSNFNGSTGGCGGTCSSTDRTSMTAMSLLANAYADLGTYSGVTPYVGAGIGGAKVNWASLQNTGCSAGTCTTYTHQGYDEYRFAYALMAGVSYDLTHSLALDLGYRWMHVAGGNMFGGDNAAGGPYTGQGKDKGLDFHSIKAGLRYKFGAEPVPVIGPAVASYEPAPQMPMVYK
jgi:opacity protein-like surface antigen